MNIATATIGALLLSRASGFHSSSPETPARLRRHSDSAWRSHVSHIQHAIPTFAPSDEKLEPEKVVMDASWFLQFGKFRSNAEHHLLPPLPTTARLRSCSPVDNDDTTAPTPLGMTPPDPPKTGGGAGFAAGGGGAKAKAKKGKAKGKAKAPPKAGKKLLCHTPPDGLVTVLRAQHEGLRRRLPRWPGRWQHRS